jgi:hypothetical protein
MQIIGFYDNRTSVGTIAAPDAHAMVKATRKPSSDITRKQAEKIAADHGLVLLGSKPRLVLMDGDVMVDTLPYKLICHRDVKVYCEQIHTQKHQASLVTLSDDQIRTESEQALALIF